MTTVLFFGGVLGVDSCASSHGYVVSRTPKLLEIDGRFFAVAGDIAVVAGFCKRLCKKKMRKGAGLHVDDGVAVELLSNSHLRQYAGEGYLDVAPDSFYATGSGSAAALGAMHAGADLVTSLRCAAKVDGYTRGPFDLVRYDIKDQKFIRWSAP